jgi:hypothetical protein
LSPDNGLARSGDAIRILHKREKMAKKKQPQELTNRPENPQEQIPTVEVTSLYLSFESYFPSRVRAIISGTLGNHRWIREITPTRQGNNLNIEIFTEENTTRVWTPVKFEEEISLDISGFSEGKYSVHAGDQIAIFNVEKDTVSISSEINPAGAPLAPLTARMHAQITDINLYFERYFPTRVLAIIDGNLMYSGMSIKEIRTEQEGNNFNIEIITKWIPGFGKPVPFHEKVSLDVSGITPGNYTVQVEDQTATFVVQQDTIVIPQPLEQAMDRPQHEEHIAQENEVKNELVKRAKAMGLKVN